MSETDAGKLAACPFCSGTDIRFDRHIQGRSPTGEIWSMYCYQCGATFPNRYRKELLVEKWNTRTPPTGNAMREALEAFQKIQACADNSGAVYTIASKMIDDLAAQPQEQREQREANHFEQTAAGVIDWKAEAERANRLLAAQQQREAVQPVAFQKIEPHIYSPDYQAMGDCRICGHDSEKPWHQHTAPPPLPDSAGAGGEREALASFGHDRKKTWLLRFEDADEDDMIFDNEADARSAYGRHSFTWNCTLFETSALSPHSGKSE